MSARNLDSCKKLRFFLTLSLDGICARVCAMRVAAQVKKLGLAVRNVQSRRWAGTVEAAPALGSARRTKRWELPETVLSRSPQLPPRGVHGL